MRAPYKQKSPAALVEPRPGGILRHESSYPRAADLQSAGERFAAAWRDTAERFVSTFYRALTDPIGPAIRAVLVDAFDRELQLGPQHFPSAALAALVTILTIHSEQGRTPTIASIIAMARGANLMIVEGGGDPAAELRAVLECESSAALLIHHARELVRFSRKTRQVARLYRALRDRLEAPVAGAARTAPIRLRGEVVA